MARNKAATVQPKNHAPGGKRSGRPLRIQTERTVNPGRHHEAPQSGRSMETYEKLITAAGELLGEVGFEKLTTNAICARAGLTPPALYRYFHDKYEVLEALARKLLKKQNDAFAAWMFQGGTWKDPAGRAKALEEWFRICVGLTTSEPGALWTLRALRALPNLAHIRLESQRQSTDQMFEFYRRIYPNMPAETLWCRIRVVAEFGFAVDELALEEDRIPHDVLFREAARVLGIPYDYEVHTHK
jgi:AcrR family transcriptional regulator